MRSYYPAAFKEILARLRREKNKGIQREAVDEIAVLLFSFEQKELGQSSLWVDEHGRDAHIEAVSTEHIGRVIYHMLMQTKKVMKVDGSAAVTLAPTLFPPFRLGCEVLVKRGVDLPLFIEELLLDIGRNEAKAKEEEDDRYYIGGLELDS